MTGLQIETNITSKMKIEDFIKTDFNILGEYWREFKTGLYLLLAFLNIDVDLALVLMYLMVTDTILGTIKAIYIYKIKFSFKKLLWGIITKAVVLIIPMVLALVASAFDFNFKWMVDLVIKIIIVSEGISSFTNILAMKERKNIENTDYVSKLLNSIRKFCINKIEKLLESIDDEKKI